LGYFDTDLPPRQRDKPASCVTHRYADADVKLSGSYKCLVDDLEPLEG
jgi:hypothetical protein